MNLVKTMYSRGCQVFHYTSATFYASVGYVDLCIAGLFFKKMQQRKTKRLKHQVPTCQNYFADKKARYRVKPGNYGGFLLLWK